MARTSVASGSGYWTVTSTGQVHAYGGARYFGGMTSQHLNQSIVGSITRTGPATSTWPTSGGVDPVSASLVITRIQ